MNEGNVDEIGTVPLFIKAPGQRRGRINRAYVSTLDLTPTIADILNFRMPYRTHGRSAFSRAVRRRRVISLPTRDFSRTDLGAPLRGAPAAQRQPPPRALRVGPAGQPVHADRALPQPRRQAGRRAPAGLPGPPACPPPRGLGLQQGRPRGRAGAGGRQHAGGRRGAKHDVAVAVNGVIRAVGRTWYLRGRRTEYFAMNVPEASLRSGRNVEVFVVRRNGAPARRVPDPSRTSVALVRLRARVLPHARPSVHVDEQAVPAIAVVERDAGAEVAVAEAGRLNGAAVRRRILAGRAAGRSPPAPGRRGCGRRSRR